MGGLRESLKRTVSYADLEDVQLSKHPFREPSLAFSARRLEIFTSIPGARGFLYVVDFTGSSHGAWMFVTEALLAIAAAATNRFSDQI